MMYFVIDEMSRTQMHCFQKSPSLTYSVKHCLALVLFRLGFFL